MHKFLIALSLGVAILLQTPHAFALSCLPIDMYLEGAIGEESTQIFIGTATQVKDHAQVVTVTKALQGWIAPTVWVQHPYSNDWKYYCSNGPAKAGESTVFFTTIDQYGSRTVVQTLDVDSDMAKDFLSDIAKEKVDADITDAKPADRVTELMQSVTDLIEALINMLRELSYWQNK